MAKQEKNESQPIAISACLLGIPCRYNNQGKSDQEAITIFVNNRCIAICPETMASLPTPRPACEINQGDGHDVLSGQAKVVDKDGHDYSEDFIKGAKKCLDIIKKAGVKEVILKSGSPSCGAVNIYDGSFSGHQKKGQGVFAALLQEHGIRIREQ